MLVQALEEMRIPVGAKVEIETVTADNNKKRRKITGKIIQCSRRHFTVQWPMYRETFLKIDLVQGHIKLKSKNQPAGSRSLGEEIISAAFLQSAAYQTSEKKEAI